MTQVAKDIEYDSPDSLMFLQYLAPEKHRRHAETEKGDVWSIGAMIFYILTDLEPYQGFSEDEAHKLLRRGVPPTQVMNNSHLFRRPDPYLNALHEAMEMCFVVDLHERPSAREVADFLESAITKLASNNE
jgi:serine/threonine protein kinase